MKNISPQQLAAVYDCLRSFPPFKGWKLPPSDEVAFHVLRTPNFYGFYTFDAAKGVHVIEISEKIVGHLNTLMAKVAHEMIHMRQHIVKSDSKKTFHNAQFKKYAATVCREHGFDPKDFV